MTRSDLHGRMMAVDRNTFKAHTAHTRKLQLLSLARLTYQYLSGNYSANDKKGLTSNKGNSRLSIEDGVRVRGGTQCTKIIVFARRLHDCHRSMEIITMIGNVESPTTSTSHIVMANVHGLSQCSTTSRIQSKLTDSPTLKSD
mmetsp:Transcript_11768/g.22015  ORF Transcript_11768/g.22015 Transcript_11768/m.22015 type:complete len:143 (-) Transcript_11768:155-583(-)